MTATDSDTGCIRAGTLDQLSGDACADAGLAAAALRIAPLSALHLADACALPLLPAASAASALPLPLPASAFSSLRRRSSCTIASKSAARPECSARRFRSPARPRSSPSLRRSAQCAHHHCAQLQHQIRLCSRSVVCALCCSLIVPRCTSPSDTSRYTNTAPDSPRILSWTALLDIRIPWI